MRFGQRERNPARRVSDRAGDPRDKAFDRRTDVSSKRLPAGFLAIEVEEVHGHAFGFAEKSESFETGRGVGRAFGDGHLLGSGGEDGVEHGAECLAHASKEAEAMADEVRLDQHLAA